MARKTKLDWVHAGQSALINHGIKGVKLHRLTQALGVSTGSFYHHFSSFDDYLAELAEHYGSEQAQLPFDTARKKVGDDPRQILIEATTIFGISAGRALNIAMRSWAQTDPRAAAAVDRYLHALEKNLDEIFFALGYNEIEAKSRTLIMIGLASVELTPKSKPDFGDRWRHIRDTLVLAEK